MVDDLPKQLECPLCVATLDAYVELMESLKSYVSDLEVIKLTSWMMLCFSEKNNLS